MNHSLQTVYTDIGEACFADQRLGLFCQCPYQSKLRLRIQANAALLESIPGKLSNNREKLSVRGSLLRAGLPTGVPRGNSLRDD